MWNTHKGSDVARCVDLFTRLSDVAGVCFDGALSLASQVVKSLASAVDEVPWVSCPGCEELAGISVATAGAPQHIASPWQGGSLLEVWRTLQGLGLAL